MERKGSIKPRDIYDEESKSFCGTVDFAEYSVPYSYRGKEHRSQSESTRRRYVEQPFAFCSTQSTYHYRVVRSARGGSMRAKSCLRDTQQSTKSIIVQLNARAALIARCVIFLACVCIFIKQRWRSNNLHVSMQRIHTLYPVMGRNFVEMRVGISKDKSTHNCTMYYCINNVNQKADVHLAVRALYINHYNADEF